MLKLFGNNWCKGNRSVIRNIDVTNLIFAIRYNSSVHPFLLNFSMH